MGKRKVNRKSKQPRKTARSAAAAPVAAAGTDPLPRPQKPTGLSLKWVLIGVCAIVVISLTAGWWLGKPDSNLVSDVEATYVGRSSCIDCHGPQAKDFHGSHHDRAMDVATDDTVLAQFEGELEHHGVTSRFFRKDNKFMVNTEGPDGKMQDFEVKYVFGVEPLQQYMVEFDRPESMPDDEIARLQVLRLCWDTENDKWFFLDPPDVNEKLDPTDPLHWTSPAQCWNTSCAECHSTHLEKNFDPDSLVYHTQFSEIDVSCEACHGPGSKHVEIASKRKPNWRKLGTGLVNLKTKANTAQVESCAPCHSRRRVLANGYHAGKRYDDHYQVEFLYDQTYHADGQIKDEDYVYGSFLQSKMYHKNIRCTDCHDPHSTKVKFQGNQLCTSCHQHPAAKYDSPSHHHHQPGSAGAQCVNCHMPETTYMAVDPRRDHSIRIPRPDLSVSHQLPNACSSCHIDNEKLSVESRKQVLQYQDWVRLAKENQSEIKAELSRVDQQMAAAFETWYGEKLNDRPVSLALLEARTGRDESVQMLREIVENSKQPAIYRATSLFELNRFDGEPSYRIASNSLSDPEPAVIVAALPRVERELGMTLSRLSRIDPAQVQEVIRKPVSELLPLLQHERAVVRIEAARVVASVPLQFRRSLLSKAEREAFTEALSELEAMYMVNNDRAMAYVALANLKEALGDPEAAKEALFTGIRVEPQSAGPRSNLAAIIEREAEQLTNEARQLLTQRRRADYEVTIKQAEAKMWEVASLRAEELILLERDVERLPTVAALQYRFGLALHLAGDAERAEAALLEAHQLEPGRSDYLLALALFYQRQQNWDQAIRFAQELVALIPEDPSYQMMLQQIRQQALGLTAPGSPNN